MKIPFSAKKSLKKKLPTGSEIKRGKDAKVLTVVAFQELFKLEACMFTKDGGDNDDFVNHWKQCDNDEIEDEELEDAGFAEAKPRRVSGSANVIAKNKEKSGKFWRFIMIRCVPSGSASESRQE